MTIGVIEVISNQLMDMVLMYIIDEIAPGANILTSETNWYSNDISEKLKNADAQGIDVVNISGWIPQYERNIISFIGQYNANIFNSAANRTTTININRRKRRYHMYSDCAWVYGAINSEWAEETIIVGLKC